MKDKAAPRQLKAGDKVVIKFGPRHAQCKSKWVQEPPVPGKWYDGQLMQVEDGEYRIELLGSWAVYDPTDSDPSWSDAIMIRKVAK